MARLDADRVGRLQALAVALAGRASTVRSVAVIPFDPMADAAWARAWKARLLREAYAISWLPGEVVENIRHVRYDRESWRVDIELASGSVIRDHGDVIDVIGDPDDVGVDEIAAAVLRRTPSWDAVEIRGDAEFRRATAWALLAARPDIIVAECLLSDEELTAARQGLPPVPPATTAAFLAHLAGGHPAHRYAPPDERD